MLSHEREIVLEPIEKVSTSAPEEQDVIKISIQLLKDSDVCEYLDSNFNFYPVMSDIEYQLGKAIPNPIEVTETLKKDTVDRIEQVMVHLDSKGEALSSPVLGGLFGPLPKYRYEDREYKRKTGAIRLWNAFGGHPGCIALFIYAYKGLIVTNDFRLFFNIDLNKKEILDLKEKAIETMASLVLGHFVPGIGLMFKYEEWKLKKEKKELFNELKNDLIENPLTPIVLKFRN